MGDSIALMMQYLPLFTLLPLIFGWLLDSMIGDPTWMPHPVVLFGNVISKGERVLNKDGNRKMKGAIFSIFLILLVFIASWGIITGLNLLHPYLILVFSVLMVFYCLAGKGLIHEVRQVFIEVDKSLEAGRKQVGRIVGRDTSQLNAQQIRTAALETLAENLSDGVIAPLFWFCLLGVPGMLAYKMINTLDSMIGYKSERYKDFGCWAAKIDDVANYIPARITAFLMLIVSGSFSGFSFVKKYGKKHASPNSGFPESALASILNCQFGGPNIYFDTLVDKPYIGENPKELTTADMKIAVKINRRTEVVMVILVAAILCVLNIIKL